MPRAAPLLLFFVLPLTLPSLARADETSGYSLGARLGWGIPLGKISGGNTGQDLTKVASGMLPIQIDAGYRLNPDLYLGLYFQLGIAFLSSDYPPCKPAGTSCSGTDLRYGVDFRWYFLHEPSVDPWLGIGVGREDASLSIAGNTLSAGGWEFAKIELGTDFLASQKVRFGPVFAVTFDEFTAESLNGNSVDIATKTLHHWVLVGLKGQYDL
jgi:hypothetical protein